MVALSGNVISVRDASKQALRPAYATDKPMQL
jgi:hypothetical protein